MATATSFKPASPTASATTNKMVTAMFRDRQQSNRAYQWLLTRGYGDNDINVLMSVKTRESFREAGEEGPVSVGSHVAEGAATGGAIGTTIGAIAAAIAAIGTSIVVPGLGLVVAGPIAAALAGAGAGAVVGGAVGGLIGMGIPESNARAYETALADGGVVLGVLARNDADIEVIKECFKDHDGENVVTSNCTKC